MIKSNQSTPSIPITVYGTINSLSIVFDKHVKSFFIFQFQLIEATITGFKRSIRRPLSKIKINNSNDLLPFYRCKTLDKHALECLMYSQYRYEGGIISYK
jgi:hypothetical protein